MRLPLAVGIGGTLLAAATAVLLWPEPPAVVRVPAVAPAPRPPANDLPAVAAQAPAPRPVPAPRPEGIALQGVMARADAAQSEALLSTQAGGSQIYRQGALVADGWVLRRIAADHVVLARGEAEARLDMAGAAPQAAAAQPQEAASSAALAATAAGKAAADAPPGLVPGPPPRAVSGTPESNRRFLQDRRERMAAQARQNP